MHSYVNLRRNAKQFRYVIRGSIHILVQFISFFIYNGILIISVASDRMISEAWHYVAFMYCIK
jgi:hypothetical protein